VCMYGYVDGKTMRKSTDHSDRRANTVLAAVREANAGVGHCNNSSRLRQRRMKGLELYGMVRPGQEALALDRLLDVVEGEGAVPKWLPPIPAQTSLQPAAPENWSDSAQRVAPLPASLSYERSTKAAGSAGDAGFDPEGERKRRVRQLGKGQETRVRHLAAEVLRLAAGEGSAHEHGHAHARRLGEVRAALPCVHEALLAGVHSPDERMAFESSRALLALGFRGDVLKPHQIFFSHLVASRNEGLLADILTTIVQVCTEDSGEWELAAQRVAEMEKLTSKIKAADRKRIHAPSSQKKHFTQRIEKAEAEIAARMPALAASRARLTLIPTQCHLLCAGVKSVLRRTVGEVRLKAAVCLAHLSRADVDAAAILRGYVVRVETDLSNANEKFRALDALLGSMKLADLSLLPYCVQQIWMPGSVTDRIRICQVTQGAIEKSARQSQAEQAVAATSVPQVVDVPVPDPEWDLPDGVGLDGHLHHHHDRGPCGFWLETKKHMYYRDVGLHIITKTGGAGDLRKGEYSWWCLKEQVPMDWEEKMEVAAAASGVVSVNFYSITPVRFLGNSARSR